MNITKLRGFTLFILLCGLLCIASLPIAAQQGNFKVTLNGYLVNEQTNEGITLDGSGDELTLVSHVGRVDSSGRLSRIIWGSSFTSIMNGQQRGGCFPASNPCAPWQRTTPAINANPPAILFEGEIVQNTNAALIIPTIWEWDGVGNLNLMGNYANQIDRDQNNLTSEVANMIRTPSLLQLDKYLRPGAGMRINNTVTLAGGIPQNRPIGMNSTGFNQFGFTPQALVLTFQAADFISRTNFGRGIGVVPVNYVDASGMGGNYTLFLQVERTDEVQPCPANLASTFNADAVMIITDPNDPKHPIGPITTPISIPVEFTECRSRVRITNFPVIRTPSFPVITSVGERQNITTITQTGGGDGNFTAGNGRLVLTTTLHFEHSLQKEFTIFARPSDLTLNLTTQEGGGSKKDSATGNIVLVGSAQFSGGFLNGRTGSLTVTGSFSPRP